jgi:fumarate hydratase subunit beta
MNEYNLALPLTKARMQKLASGDIVYLTGYLYTARDAAHKRIQQALAGGGQPPVDFQDQTVFYAGPCPAKPGRAIGPIAPTTSMRMDQYVEMMFKLGMVAMIGKGDRSGYVSDLCRQYGGVYLLSIGGASALISNQVKTCAVVAYDDLGTESIKRLYVENLRVIVGIDTQGDVFQDREIAKYKRT